MFETTRKHTRVIQLVLFLLIVPSFVLFGLDGYTRMSDSGVVIAKAPDYKLTEPQFDAMVKQEVDQILLQQPNLDVKLIDTPEFRKRVLDRALNEAVMNHAAKVNFVYVSESKLAKALLESPEIAALKGSDGKIDMEAYKQLAGAQGLTPDGFEQRVASNLAMRQGFEPLTNSGFVPKSAASGFTKAFFEKREIQTFLVKPADFVEKVKPNDQELEAFFKSNSKNYQSDESVDIEYVVLDAKSLSSQANPSEEQIKSYYDANLAQFGGQEERKSSHILIAVAADAKPADKEKAKKKAQDILAQAKAKPADFAKLATTYSDDTGSKPAGGDLGFVAKNGSFVKPFEDALFSLEKGAISELVESQFGYHIIQLTDIKAAQVKPLVEVKPQIVEALNAQGGQKAFAEASESFSNLVYEQSDSFKSVADKFKLEVKKIDKLSKNGVSTTTDPLVANAKFLEAVFSPEAIKDKRNSTPISLDGSVLVSVRVLSHQPQKAQSFAEVKDRVRAGFVAKRSQELALEEGKKLLAQWQASPDAAKGLSAPMLVSRDNTAGLPPKLLELALRMKVQDAPLFAGLDLGKEGYALVKHLRQVEVKATPEQESTVAAQLLQARQAAEVIAYLEQTKRRYNVKIMTKDLDAVK